VKIRLLGIIVVGDPKRRWYFSICAWFSFWIFSCR